MRRMFMTILACMSLSTLGVDALVDSNTSDQLAQQQTQEQTVEKHCKRGPRGHRGHRGRKGRKGKMGPQGEAGTPFIPEYGEAYVNTTWEESFELPVNTPDKVLFNAVGPLSSNVSYNPTDYTFTVNAAGTYSIEYAVKASSIVEGLGAQHINTMMLQVVVNGVPQVMTLVPGAEPLSLPIDEQYPFIYAEASNQITLPLAAGDVIKLQVAVMPFNEQFGVTAYYGVPGPEAVQQTAYLSIEKIG